jgi:endonuclease YncB( thermonuclease family)
MPPGLRDSKKKAPLMGAFFLFAVLLWQPHAGQACSVDHVDETVQVRYVFDGDTVELKDGRKVRLLGINTPELDHEHGHDEPLARAARRALQDMLGDADSVALRYGQRRHDHYGRTLAHVIVDGRRDVQLALLKQGLAAAIAVSPNLWHVDCYRDAELRARQRHQGIWGQAYYHPLDVDRRQPQRGGFRLLQGHIRHVGVSKAFVWFDLDNGVALRLAQADQAYFPDRAWRDWQGRRIEARGWLYRIRRSDWQMNIHHPQNLVRLEVHEGDAARPAAGRRATK